MRKPVLKSVGVFVQQSNDKVFSCYMSFLFTESYVMATFPEVMLRVRFGRQQISIVSVAKARFLVSRRPLKASLYLICRKLREYLSVDVIDAERLNIIFNIADYV